MIISLNKDVFDSDHKCRIKYRYLKGSRDESFNSVDVMTIKENTFQ